MADMTLICPLCQGVETLETVGVHLMDVHHLKRGTKIDYVTGKRIHD